MATVGVRGAMEARLLDMEPLAVHCDRSGSGRQ